MNWIGLWSLTKREIKRTFKVINQVIWPPLIATLLYLFVFGLSLGDRIPQVDGLPYLHFLIPGLLMMYVMSGAYEEASSSLFQMRFLGFIQEILTAPLSYLEMVMGLTAAGVLRAFLIGNLIWLVGFLVVGLWPAHWGLYLLSLALIAVCFSSLGLILGLWAERWDHLAFLTTFVVTPLVYFGGIFHSVNMLPPTFQFWSKANPLFYMIDAIRYSLTGASVSPIALDLAVLGGLAATAFATALLLFRSGYKLRT